MALPIKRFWFLVNQVDRIRAERDLRQLALMASVTTAEGYSASFEGLTKQQGTIYVWSPVPPPSEIRIDPDTGLDPEFDRAGLQALKAKYGRK